MNITKFDYKAQALQDIKAVIKTHPEFDINELLYNADDVADKVFDLVDEVVDTWGEVDDLTARDRVCSNMDLCRCALSESCMNYEEQASMFFCNDWGGLDWEIRRYMAVNWDNIKDAIAELITEYEKQA